MRLYNTLTRAVTPFKPLKQGQVSLYSCGPTVYDHVHIGNLSSFVYADLLRRVLIASDYSVKHLMNFTDVDDKTIARSLEEYPKLDAEEALHKLTSHFSGLFLGDMTDVGNDVGAMTFVKATASIKEMQKMISELLDKGFAYESEDGVYFSIENYRASGKKYGQLVDISNSSTSKARISNDEYDKESIHDFALWKLQRDGEPAWDYNVGSKNLRGRPGWHIECSAMSKAGLGIPFDIHTGGVDLMFPHHENEIAQSTACEAESTLATFFVHNEHLLVDGRKMSKSLGNFHTLETIKAKGYDPLAFRLMVLQAHYRSQTDFTWVNLAAAANRLRGFRATSDLRFQPQTEGEGEEVIDTAKRRILTTLQNDLATPEALSILNEFATIAEKNGLNHKSLPKFKDFIVWLDELFGLQLSESKDVAASQFKLIEERNEAKRAKDWTKADQIRNELLKQGIGLRDTPQGHIWYRA